MKGVSIEFSRYADANFQKKAELIYNSMNGNPIYESLAAQVTAVKAALDMYTEDLQQAGTRERNAVARKNQSRQALTVLLRQLGLNVVVVAAGDEVALVSSGYTLDKNGSRAIFPIPEISRYRRGSAPVTCIALYPRWQVPTAMCTRLRTYCPPSKLCGPATRPAPASLCLPTLSPASNTG